MDGFHPVNVGKLVQNRPAPRPCTPAGVMELLKREGIELKGKRAVVVGRSDIVGKPMAMLLLHEHATVTICHSRTRDLAAVTREAEILVAAIGRPAILSREYIGAGAVVIDVGMNRAETEEQVRDYFGEDAGRLEVVSQERLDPGGRRPPQGCDGDRVGVHSCAGRSRAAHHRDAAVEHARAREGPARVTASSPC